MKLSVDCHLWLLQEKIAKLEAATETAQSVAAPAVTDFGWLNQVTMTNPLDPQHRCVLLSTSAMADCT